jgi:hypothetical protein
VQCICVPPMREVILAILSSNQVSFSQFNAEEGIVPNEEQMWKLRVIPPHSNFRIKWEIFLGIAILYRLVHTSLFLVGYSIYISLFLVGRYSSLKFNMYKSITVP